jgi:hypothetical protein
VRRLARRVRGAGDNLGRVQEQMTPLSSVQPMGSAHPAVPAGTPMVMPLALVSIIESPGGYGSQRSYYQVTPGSASDPSGGVAGMTYQDVTTMWGPNGEPIPATMPGGWGQLRRAGRP